MKGSAGWFFRILAALVLVLGVCSTSSAQTGSISGTVTDETNGNGLAAPVAIYDSSGTQVKFVTDTAATGNYSVSGLATGTYFARTVTTFTSTLNFVDELYANIPCSLGGCTITSGTPIVVVDGAVTTGIDFALTPGGSISGVVTDTSTGAGVPNGSTVVVIMTASGAPLTSDLAGSAGIPGAYVVSRLAPGTYFARTALESTSSANYVNKLFGNVICVPLSTCLANVTNGTPIVVTAGQTSVANFSLSPGGTISGRVSDEATDAGLQVPVSIFDAAGVFVKTGAALPSGTYSVTGLPTGTYYARTALGSPTKYLDELFNNVPCAPSCTVTAGTPISVTAGVVIPNVNFSLASTGPTPTLTTIAPFFGSTLGGRPVTLTGTNFVSGATVTIADVAAINVIVVNATTITAVTGPHPPSFGDVVVTNPDGQFATINGGFEYVPFPSVTSIAPAIGDTAGGTLITISGADFLSPANVTIGGVPADAVNVVNDTTITAVTGPHAAGVVDFRVTNGTGLSLTLAGGFTYAVAPAPTLTAVSPLTGSTAGGTAVTILGTKFTTGATVSIGGVAATNVVVVSPTVITATTGAHAAGAVNVIVTGPDAQTGTRTNGFTYQTQVNSNDNFINRLPITGGGNLTTTGSNVGATAETGEPTDEIQNATSASSVWWTWTAPCSFTVNAPNAFISTAGSSFDTVASVFTGLSPLSLFAANDDEVPGSVFTSRIPSSGSLNIVTGTAYQIRVRGFFTGVQGQGTIVLRVTSPCAANSAPMLSSVSPPVGSTAGFNATITGTNFVPGASVIVDNVAATNVSVTSTTITFTAPAHAAGTVTLEVTNPSPDFQIGRLASGLSFTLQATPTVTAIAPAIGSTAFANTVTISGTNFIPPCSVNVGGSVAASTFLSPTTVVATTQVPHSAGTVFPSLTCAGFTSAPGPSFTFNSAPTISSIGPRTIGEDATTGLMFFSIGDLETSPGNLTLSTSSTNTDLVSVGNITFDGVDGDRAVTVTPAADRSGSTQIQISVSDGLSTASTTFTLTVGEINDAPAISALGPQTTSEDVATSPLAFTIADVETAPASLTLSGSSSNTALVPNSSIVFGGAGANRTVTVTPGGNVSGSATITVTVGDGSSTASTQFVLTVNGSNDAPTVSPIAAKTTNEDTPASAIAFTIVDAETASTNLTVSASSSDQTLVPNANLVLSGGGGGRTLGITPAANQSGTATITVSVSDGNLTTNSAFVLTVTPVNDAPTIAPIAPQTTDLNAPVGPIAFTINDIDTAAGSLILSGGSSNPALVPVSGLAFGGSGTDRTITVSPSSSQSGVATITVTVSDGALSASTSFALTVSTPSLTLSPSSLKFAAAKAGAGGAILQVTPAQTVSVSVTGLSTAWTASADQPWVQITSGSGSASGQMKIGIVDPSNVLGGAPAATSTVTVTAGSLSATVAVSLTVDTGSTTGIKAPPNGSFDTPTNGATSVVGAIPVTGWALDDLAVARVQIWRNCVEAIDRPAGACAASVPGGPADFVFIGDGAFLAGARPDVEALNPTVPQANRAGWGYLMSTNALPHLPTGRGIGGQGTFTLSAYAVDIEGQFTLLGTKSITLDNDGAIVPFGAIDSPEQGGLVTANIFASFGWAMTQNPKCIDTTATASYKVYIDGVSLPLVAGVNWFSGLARPDLAAAYPGLCNTNNALAAYFIDVAALGLSNGLHTTGWDVIDSDGNIAGIGSRFFNVLIGAGASTTLGAGGADIPSVVSGFSRTSDVGSGFSRISDVGSGFSRISDGTIAATDTHAIRLKPDPTVRVQSGSDSEPFQIASADASGRYHVQFPAGGRLAIDLGGPVDAGYQMWDPAFLARATSRAAGFEAADLRALPPGSSLNAASGVFAWMPPVPFLGPFQLVFVRGGERIDVTVTIADPTVRSNLTLHIDTPASEATVRGAFVVAGWAIDTGAAAGSGIDTLHAWAYRRDGVAEPQFLGAAAVGGARPDVAAIYGEQFSASGFTLTTSALSQGVYDILVYPHRVNGAFTDAAIVRVIVR